MLGFRGLARRVKLKVLGFGGLRCLESSVSIRSREEVHARISVRVRHALFSHLPALQKHRGVEKSMQDRDL